MTLLISLASRHAIVHNGKAWVLPVCAVWDGPHSNSMALRVTRSYGLKHQQEPQGFEWALRCLVTHSTNHRSVLGTAAVLHRRPLSQNTRCRPPAGEGWTRLCLTGSCT
jgi:hypothetical protein